MERLRTIIVVDHVDDMKVVSTNKGCLLLKEKLCVVAYSSTLTFIPGSRVVLFNTIFPEERTIFYKKPSRILLYSARVVNEISILASAVDDLITKGDGDS